MKYKDIEFELNADGEPERLCCPVCNAVWISVEDGEAMPTNKPCEHFMFMWEQDADDPTCHNGLTPDSLYEQIVAHFKALNPQDIWEDMDTRDIVREIFFEQEFWESLQLDGVDMILDQTQEFMCCGPSAYTVLFGVRNAESGA